MNFYAAICTGSCQKTEQAFRTIRPKEAFIKEIPVFEENFEKVVWETNYFTRRPEYDGTFKTKEVFSFEKSEGVAKHTKTTYRYPFDEYKGDSKYHDYDWNKLEQLIQMLNTENF